MLVVQGRDVYCVSVASFLHLSGTSWVPASLAALGGGDEGGRGGALPGLRKFWGRRCAGQSPRNGGPATPQPRQRFWIVCLFPPPASRTFSTVALSIPSAQRAFAVRFSGLSLGTVSKLRNQTFQFCFYLTILPDVSCGLIDVPFT